MNGNSTWSKAASVALVALVVAACTGCDDKPAAALAPVSSALATAKAATGTQRFVIDRASSKVDFTMDAPQEKIRGRVPGATEGELQVDLTDLTRTTGLLTVDLTGIEVYQQKIDDSGKPGKEEKSEAQNTHVRNWLEIADDVPADARKKNLLVQFSVASIDGASVKDVTKLSGPSRTVTLKATGDFLLHGRKAQKTAELEATFTFEGTTPKSVSVRSVKPFSVGLAEHDVKPRESFGKLAQKTLELLAPKVAKDAEVSIAFTGNLAPGAGSPAKAP